MVSPGNEPGSPSGPSYIVSACLAGIDCTHTGSNKKVPRLAELVASGRAMPVCPEVMGGSGIPREACEIKGGDGRDLVRGLAKAVTSSGQDVSGKLLLGAKRALDIARRFGIKKAVLKSRSPSCGKGQIYDGTFGGTLRDGDGVAAALLADNGIIIYTEKDYHEE